MAFYGIYLRTEENKCFFSCRKVNLSKKVITEKIVQMIVKFNPMASQMFVTVVISRFLTLQGPSLSNFELPWRMRSAVWWEADTRSRDYCNLNYLCLRYLIYVSHALLQMLVHSCKLQLIVFCWFFRGGILLGATPCGFTMLNKNECE